MIDIVKEEAVSMGGGRCKGAAPSPAPSPCAPPRSNGYLCGAPGPPGNGAAPKTLCSEQDDPERGRLLPAADGHPGAQQQQQQQLRLHENPLCAAPGAAAGADHADGAASQHTVVDMTRLRAHSVTTTTKVRRKSGPAPRREARGRRLLSWASPSLNRFVLAAGAAALIAAAVLLVAAVSSYSCSTGGETTKTCLSEECVRTAASLLSAMDRTASPCQDFFQYACGAWNKRHIIPEDRSSISTFEVLAEQLNHILKDILDEDIDENDSNATRKAKIFYKSCMDLALIRKVGDEPLKEVLASLGGWPVTVPGWSPPDYPLEVLLGRLRELSEGVLFQQWVGPDDKNSSVNILQLDQLQLALPSRDYYLKSPTESELKAYHKYMTEVAILMGASREAAEGEMTDVINFEKRLAEASLPEADRHDTSLNYQQLPLWRLQQDVPELDWHLFLTTVLRTNISMDEPVVCYGLPYFRSMGRILARTDRRVVHNYVLWRLLMSVIPHMTDEYQQKRVEFRRVMHGILSERSRWAQCVELTNKKLGMAVGALFIRENFNHESKETALEMIHNIREAFNELLAENAWMDDETRAVAKEKADAMNERIGYPDMLTSPEELNQEYVMLNVTPGQFLVNILNVLRYEAYHNLQNLRQPVNRDKWSTEPVVVNAFYNPNKNDIMFPAGILQPLFYSKHFPKSLNYGGIGVVIGHEITHGFDDKGRQFDKDGNLMQWWNNSTVRAFRERAQCIVDQYSRYKLADITSYINGRMTQGENIADNGGLKQSFRAYRKWVAKHGEEPRLPGINLTHNQLFFLNYAQIWCGSMRPEDALSKVRSSVHPPGPIRVLGPLSNSNDFAEAFSCPPGSPMNPSAKCSVW